MELDILPLAAVLLPQAVSAGVTCGDGVFRWASVGPGKLDSMKAADRERRDVQVVRLFLGGSSYRAIAGAVGLRSPQSVGNIVQRALEGSSQRRDLLTDEAFAVWQERSERLLRAHWGAALEGNHRSAELCRKILAQHVLVYGLAQEVSLAGTRADAVEPEPDEADMDELAKLRAARARVYG